MHALCTYCQGIITRSSATGRMASGVRNQNGCDGSAGLYWIPLHDIPQEYSLKPCQRDWPRSIEMDHGCILFVMSGALSQQRCQRRPCLWKGVRKVKNRADQFFSSCRALTEAPPHWQNYLQRMKAKLGSAATTTARAHKIAIVFYTLGINQVEYDETSGPAEMQSDGNSSKRRSSAKLTNSDTDSFRSRTVRPPRSSTA